MSFTQPLQTKAPYYVILYLYHYVPYYVIQNVVKNEKSYTLEYKQLRFTTICEDVQ